MNVNCEIFELIYNLISQDTLGLVYKNVKNDLIDVLIYDMNCSLIDENCIKQYNC